MRTYFIILIGVLVLFLIVRGCDRYTPTLLKSFASKPATDTATAPLPPAGDQQAHLRRLRAKKERELAAVLKFATAVKSADALISDHLKAIHGYLDEPRLDDNVWRDNIKVETRGLQDEVANGRAVGVPPRGRDLHKAYLAALGDYTSGATELERGLDLQDEEWIARSAKRIDMAADKVQDVLAQLKPLEDKLTADLDADEE
jgi:hypothetical protein